MSPSPTKSAASEDFVPEKIIFNTNNTQPRGRRAGGGGGGSGVGGGHENKNGDNGKDATHGNGNGNGGDIQQQQHQQLDSSSPHDAPDISSSVVFHEESSHLFDEIDDLYPHDYEGGKLVADPPPATAATTTHNNSTSTRSSTFSHSQLLRSSSNNSSNNNNNNRGAGAPASASSTSASTSTARPHSDSNLSSTNRAFTESLLTSLRNSNLGDGVPTDYDSLVSSSNDGTLARMIAEIDDRYKTSTSGGAPCREGSGGSGNLVFDENAVASSKRESIVGGRQITEMSFEEQRKLLAPERSCSTLVIEDDDENHQGLGRGREFSNSILSSKSHASTICSYSPTIPSNNRDGDGRSNDDNVIVSSVDWSSLSKSCKRAKNAFRDADSGEMVVKNMFFTHLSALTTVLAVHAKRCGRSNGSHLSRDYGSGSRGGRTLDEVRSRVTETKRALRFAMSCLAPPRLDDEAEAENQEGVEGYRTARQYRQELQEAAVKGFAASPSSSFAEDGDAMTQQRKETAPHHQHHHYGLQIPLVEIILAEKRPRRDSSSDDGDDDGTNYPGEDESSIEREKRTVRVLAARLLCNLVTDNPLVAEIVLRDVPFSPTPDQIESRMVGLMLGSGARSSNEAAATRSDEVISWSDLFDATAKVQSSGGARSGNGAGKSGDDQPEDREALAAIAAALHNLMTSLETRESLLDFNHEMKRREDAKQSRGASRHDRLFSVVSGEASSNGEVDAEPSSAKPIDVGFEVASNGPLLRSLLRHILPAKAVLLMHSKEEVGNDNWDRSDASRPKYKPPVSEADNMTDSATEWISLVLERLASRGLLSQMLLTAGGAKSDSVTPEQVVLVSCIRQAVDDYHTALTPTGDNGGFGRRRLSIEAKKAGMEMMARPHPLWGRSDISAGGRENPSRDSRTAVPVLFALANDAEEFRLRANALRKSGSVELYDGEHDCTIRIIVDICDILAQSLGINASSSIDEADRRKECFVADARSVLGRETPLISSCCEDLARVLDSSLARNSGRKARELKLSSQDQQTAIVMVRLVGNIVYQCRYNQDLLRITPVPATKMVNGTSDPANAFGANPGNGVAERMGLHVVLSATSLATACFTLREWCIVAIRNAVEGNAANAETVRRLEANEVAGDTPELQRMGVKVEMDDKGNVHVKKR